MKSNILLFCLSLVLVMAPCMAHAGKTLVIASVNGMCGSTVSVDVTLVNDTADMVTLSTYIDYDSAKFTGPPTITNGSTQLSSNITVTKANITIDSGAAINNIFPPIVAGRLFTLNFPLKTAANGCATSATPIGITFTSSATNGSNTDAVGTTFSTLTSGGITVVSAVPPGAPTNVTATADNAQATVTFLAPANNGAAAISKYTVFPYVGATAGTGTDLTPSAACTTASGVTSCTGTVTGLTNGTVYTFKVAATNSAGQGDASAASNPVKPLGNSGTQTLTAPVPSNLGANQVTLALQSSTSGTGYFTILSGSSAACGSSQLIRNGLDGNSTPAVRFGSLPLTTGTAGAYTVRNLSARTAYTICFTADNVAGDLPTATPATANVTTGAAVPTAHTLAWAAVGGSAVSGTSTTAFDPTFAFAPDGTPYAAYRDGSAIVVKSYAGGTWSTVVSNTTLATVSSTSYTSLAFAPDGTPYLAYLNANSIPTLMRYVTTAPATIPEWAAVGTLTGAATYISLAFAPDGSPYLAYRNASSKATVMRYDASAATPAWSAVGAADFSTGAASYLSLVFAPDGSPYLAYSDASATNQATMMHYAGGAWSAVGTASTGAATYTSLSFAPDGSPYLAYINGSNQATVMKYAAAAWSAVGSVSSSGTDTFTSLSIAPDGTPFLAYNNSSLGVATMKSYNGTNWTAVGATNVSTRPASTLSLVLNMVGRPYLVFADNINEVMVMHEPAPDAPTDVVGRPGSYLVSVEFTPTTVTGNASSTITSYTATCSPGGATGTNAVSPISVSGLDNCINGLENCTAYRCTVSATNNLGFSAPPSLESLPFYPRIPGDCNYDGTIEVGDITIARKMYNGDPAHPADVCVFSDPTLSELPISAIGMVRKAFNEQ